MNHIHALPKEQIIRLPSASFKTISKKIWSFLKDSAFVTTLRSDLNWKEFEQLEAKKTIHSFKHF